MKDAERRFTKLDPADKESINEQREALKDQIRAIDGKDTETSQTLDRSLLARQLAKKDAILDRDKRLEASGVEKDRLAARAKELEKEIRENMPTRNEMWAKPGTVDMERAVKKNMTFESKFGDKVREWKDTQHRLEPDDPLNGNVERIRPD